MPYGAGAEPGSQDQQNAPAPLTPGWFAHPSDPSLECIQDEQGFRCRKKPAMTPEGRQQRGFEESIYGRIGNAYQQERESLDAYKALERERLEETHGQQMGLAARAVGGQAAGGSAAMLRSGSTAMGQQGRYGAVELAAAQAQQEMYFKILEEELLARGASYEEIAQAIADAMYSQQKSKAAAEAEAKAYQEAADAAANEQAAGIALGVIGMGTKGAMG